MSAPLIDHKVGPDARDDPSHPIPSLAVVDVMGIRKTGGADLIIVVAAPLHSDPASLDRLLDKIDGYLRHIQSPEFQAQVGAPTPSNTTIKVALHPGSAPEVYELLERSKGWVTANNASLVVEALDVATQ
jgi:hypothetical protein